MHSVKRATNKLAVRQAETAGTRKSSQMHKKSKTKINKTKQKKN